MRSDGLRRRLRPMIVVPAALAVALVATALIVDLGGPARPDRTGVVEIVVDRYEFDPSVVALPAEEPVELRFVNSNDYRYHLVFGREPIVEDGQVTGFGEDLFAGVRAAADPRSAWRGPTPNYQGTTISLAERSTSTISVTLPAERRGSWQASCFVGRGCDAALQDALTFIVE